jgi:outer membrane protein assembly factor BamB
MRPIVLSLLLGGLSCAKPNPLPESGAALTPVPASQPTPTSQAMKNTPVLVGNTFIDPLTGERGASLSNSLQYEFARPTKTPDQYIIGDIIADATTQSILTTSRQQFMIEKDERVVRVDSTNKKLWEYTPGNRVGSLRSPELLATDSQVFVAVSDGVIALSASDGKLQWKASGPQDHLALYQGMVVAVDCTSSSVLKDRWMFAYDQKTGKEVFRFETPVDEEPETPIVVGEDLLVRGRRYSILLNAKGKELFRRDDRISQIEPMDGSRWLIATSKTIALLQADGREQWSLKGFEDTFVHESHLMVIDGDFLMYNFGAISDSGVEVARISQSGKEVWRANVAGAMVDHSEYYHLAYIIPRGDELIVVSQGSYAKFIEVLSFKTGKSLRRLPHL